MYPSKIFWKRSLQGIETWEQVKQVFGSQGKKIDKTLSLLEEHGYTFRLEEEITEDLLEKFVAIYEREISQKRAPRVLDIRGLVNTPGKRFEMIALYQGGEFLGAGIVKILEEGYSLSYKILPRDFGFNLPVDNIDFILYAKLYMRAIDLGKEYVAAGADRNFYGSSRAAAIGLPILKLRGGFFPHVKESEEVELYEDVSFLEQDWRDNGYDMLWLRGDQKGQPITVAELITQLEMEGWEFRNKYGALLKKFPGKINVYQVKNNSLCKVN
jgi:hypothetical protein